MIMTRKIIWAAVAFLIIAVLAWRIMDAIGKKQQEKNQPVAEKFTPVETGSIAMKELNDVLSQTGSIIAESEVTVYSKVPGKLVKNNVAMNDRVVADQIVAVIDRDEVGMDFKPFEVKSPATGIVSKSFLNPGAVVGPNQPLFHIVGIDRVKAVIAVPEDRIRFIPMNFPARITVEAWPNLAFQGRVTNISPIANAANHTIDIEITVANAGLKLKPGMSARAEIRLSSRQALMAPLSAVTERLGQKVVFQPMDSIAVQKPVTTGVAIGDSIEIVSGLSKGDPIIVRGSDRITDQARIRVMNK
jgi:multidrug efflux pump subunit AcrA (membrane-fusion protein)